MKKSIGARATLLSLTMLTMVGCSAGSLMRHASTGDFASLKIDLDAYAKRGNLDEGSLRDVARAILEHDLRRYSGDRGPSRVSALAACAGPLRATLRAMADSPTEDNAVASAAAQVLVDANLLNIDAFTAAHRDDPHEGWRAVATRGLIDAKEGELRSRRAQDDDRAVRRAAVGAAGDAGCASDFPLLLTSARKDPEVMVRVDAVRALSRLAERLQGDAPRADLVDRLNDLFASGDDPLRFAVSRAWGSKFLYPYGGQARLEDAVRKLDGHVAIEAASALMNAGSVEGELSLDKLARNGEPAVRAHALRILDPARPRHLDALDHAVESGANFGGQHDVSAREIAAEALLRAPTRSARAIAALKALATRVDAVGIDAAIALANASIEPPGDRLQVALRASSTARFRAATALVRIGRAADLREFMVSDDLDVRAFAACAILSVPRRK
ncbi:MAG: hypothetical protein NVSMB1_13910 [Polyangiales bacterium]